MTEQPWATKTEVKTITGEDVTDDDVVRAQHALETISGVVIPDEKAWASLGANDRRWLRNAVAYQAAFMAPSADYMTRMRVASAGADGQSATFRAEAAELAPLARKALRKLSWRGSRAVQLAAPAPVDLDSRDDRHVWRPL